MNWAELAPSPVGVRMLTQATHAQSRPQFAPNLPDCGPAEAENMTSASLYHGVSYCDAVRRAGEGESLCVLPGSIQVCRWAPVVLGLKKPQGRFEEGLTPRLSYPVTGLLLAPLDQFPGEPDLVIVRASRDTLQDLLTTSAQEQLWDGYENRLDRSAIPLFVNGETTPRHRLVGVVNRLLASLARIQSWQALTHWLFRSGAVTTGFDALISRTLTDMSICRNSTVIPLLTDRVNVSFFCTGGITWGHNHPDHLTSGWPWSIAQQLMQSQDRTHG